MILSADKLNQHSPYHLSHINDMAFSFVTDQQICYKVGFHKATFFMCEGAYLFFIDNVDGEHGAYDPKILDVITLILEEFFSQEPNVMLYICDPADQRQAARDRLYHLWFYDYARNHEMTLYSDCVTFKDTKYYTGILLRHDHPIHDMILTAYQNFLRRVPQRYSIQGK